MRRPHRLAVLGLTVVLAAACQGQAPPSVAETNGADLIGTSWTAEFIDGQPVLADVETFVRFEDEKRLTGNGGCNAFFGTYETDGDRLMIGPVGITKRACAAPINDQERRFVASLATAERFEFEDDLLLLFSDGAQAATRMVEKTD
ncbi:MAG: META domain-containing protein [Alphaproteobacteria bacterium]|nr:META domain-containing protein [Alphaproteobacteria bacterium]